LELIGLLTYLGRSHKDNTLPQLPLTMEQKAMVVELSERLNNDTKDLSLIHRLWYTFSAPPDDSQPIGKWQDPLLCFMAISHCRADGTIKPPSKATEDCAIWEYLLRSGGLYEIYTAVEEFIIFKVKQ
jgi:hypothetical protein